MRFKSASPPQAMHTPPDETYFTCTLGQAARLNNRQKDFKNIPKFLKSQARQHGDLPAVGFYLPSDWQMKILTFREVYNGTLATGTLLRGDFESEERQTVALNCSSNVEFLLVWLALMYLGHSVLLIAPQCTPKAVVELCKQSQVQWIFCDDVHDDLAKRSKEEGGEELGLKVRRVPFHDGRRAFDIVKEEVVELSPDPEIRPEDIAYLHHTSGTSSGIPKPIPQSHKAGAGVQAEFDGTQQATFTTTPLYHGGIADLFRAWTSNALIWLFPSKDLPITAMNVTKCLDISSTTPAPPIRYFSSVPYVLEMMATDPAGLKSLQAMDVVGVGGAALPNEIGDRLVEQGVNLVSRYGSAECGFLMSSHRDYANDKAWQYVRPGEGIEELRFEKNDDGLYEVVVLPGWPHMVKTNREDGSFATADLFEAHPNIKNAWRYHSRADAQLTLVTGKKFDPSPVESSIAASSPLLSDVLVFGNGRPHPGALLFRSEDGKDVSDEEVVAALAQIVEKLNTESQSHARIPRNMLIPKPYSEQPLQKSSKGTILRNQADERYGADIDAAYKTVTMDREEVADDDVENRVLEVVRSSMAPSRSEGALDAETDLFAYGVDSVACVQIRHALTQLLPTESADLPMTVVQDAGTIHRLAIKVLDVRHGRDFEEESEDQHQLMRDLVEEYSQISWPNSQNDHLTTPPANAKRPGRTVLLTGPTGSIGSHLLSQLVASSDIGHVHLLLRGATPEAAKERVRKSLEYRKLTLPAAFDQKVSIHTCTMGDTKLGLSDATHDMLAREVDMIYHLAWSVDFLLPVRGFKQHFAGLRSLMELSLAHARFASRPAELVFCSSTASVSSSLGEEIPEVIIDDPKVSGGIGYSQSKWVAENICLKISLSHPEVTDRITIVRVGQVSGDTVHGVWNQSEAYPLMLSSAKVTGCLPDLPNESLNWIPVDLAAACFVELAANDARRESGRWPRALHVLNRYRTESWSTLLRSLRKSEDFQVVNPDTWLKELKVLKASQDESKGQHPSLKLLEFWKKAYGSGSQERNVEERADPSFAMEESIKAMPSLLNVHPVDEPYMRKLWTWINENV